MHIIFNMLGWAVIFFTALVVMMYFSRPPNESRELRRVRISILIGAAVFWMTIISVFTIILQ